MRFFWFVLGIILGGASVVGAQLFPNMPQGYRDLQMQQFWQQQQQHNQWDQQDRQLWNEKPC